MDTVDPPISKTKILVVARVLLIWALIAGTTFFIPVSAETALATAISQVGSSANDAEENLNSGNVDLTSPDLQLGEFNNTPQQVGMRFTNITIPHGAVIMSAYVEFEAADLDSIPTSLTIQGQAADNAPAFVSNKDNISARPRTQAKTDWNKVPAWSVLNAKSQTPNLSGIVQEIVDRSSWTSGNSIVILIKGYGRRTATSYDGAPSAAPKLVVNYTIPMPTPTITPTSTGPTPTPPAGSIHFAVIGDYGQAGQPELDVSNLVKSWNPDFIITTGDNNYDHGEASTIDANIGQYYHEFIYPYTGTYGPGAATNRYFPALGNHDWNTLDAQAYLDYFTLPGNERYYDYVRGPVHFFVIDSTNREPDGNTSSSVQAAWLQSRLAASTSSWDVVYMHHPPYSSGGSHGSTPDLQWPYAAWGADAVLAGHDHTYERIFQDGIVYFVDGLGGESTGTFATPISGSQVRYGEDYGAMLVDGSGSQITFRFINRSGVTIDSYTLHKGSIPPTPTATSTPTGPTVGVTIGDNLMGSYSIPPSTSMRPSYAGVNEGPVKVTYTGGSPIVTSQRFIYSYNGAAASYSEMMGLPVEQLSKEYWFPYYNNVAMDSQLRVSNLGDVPTTIDVYVGTQQIDSFSLAGNGAIRKNYAGQNAGPLKVTSSDTNIVSTIRVLFNGNSYSEMMGLPKEQLSKEYLFPYYNNVAMDSQLRVSNLGGVPTTITVYLGSDPNPIDSYTLAAGSATRKNYSGKNAGPLKVTSSDTNILSTIRVLFNGSSYSEMMGLPLEQLAQEYWYPVYDNSAVDSQLRVSNMGNGPTTITVYAGSTQIDSYSLNGGAATRKNYPQNTGPLQVVSNNEPILTTIRMLYTTPTFSSYYEMMGLPDSALSTQYFFPWYNNVAMDSELRFAVP